MFARKPIGLQQNLVLAVVNHVSSQMLGFGMLAYVLSRPLRKYISGRREITSV